MIDCTKGNSFLGKYTNIDELFLSADIYKKKLCQEVS
jgi:hypothetical protein